MLNRAQFGHTPPQDIHRVRVARARELRSRTELPFAEIATACGWANRKRFSTHFRQLTQHTPAQYRRKLRF